MVRRRWDESKHPRDRVGRFADHPGGGWLSAVADRMPAPSGQAVQERRAGKVDTGEIIRLDKQEWEVVGWSRGPEKTDLHVKGVKDRADRSFTLFTHESIPVVGRVPRQTRSAPSWSIKPDDQVYLDGQFWEVREITRRTNARVYFTATNDRRQTQAFALPVNEYQRLKTADPLRAHKQAPAGEDAKWLHQRRKDALKPGRKVAKPARYANQREYRIAQEQARLAEARARRESIDPKAAKREMKKARDEGRYVPQADDPLLGAWLEKRFFPGEESTMQIEGAIDYLRESPDPVFDGPPQDGSKPEYGIAQRPNPKRPLAVYGDMLHLGGGMVTLEAARGLEEIPVDFHTVVADHMARHPGGKGGIWFGSRPITDMDHSADLKGVQPRGWREGSVWEDVNGAYRPASHVALVGLSTNSLGENQNHNTAQHEFGHALDHALGVAATDRLAREAHSPQFVKIHEQVKAEGRVSGKLNPYFQQEEEAGQQEFWAESFHVWARGLRYNDREETEGSFMQEFGIGRATARDLFDYFDAIQVRVRALAKEVTDHAFGSQA